MKQFVMIVKRRRRPAWISVFVCNSVINHGLLGRDERGSRSSFEEEPEKQLGLLRSFVFVQNIVVVALFSFFPKSLVILKLFGKGAEDTNEH